MTEVLPDNVRRALIQLKAEGPLPLFKCGTWGGTAHGVQLGLIEHEFQGDEKFFRITTTGTKILEDAENAN